jgi:CRP/FNR family transcriptional regulator
MLGDRDYARVVQALPMLGQAAPDLAREFQRVATLVHLPAGSDVFGEGDRVEAIALLLSGTVRVYKIGASGREITLYRFGLGESCVLTASAILNRRTFPALATVEQDADAVLVPAETFRRWVHESSLWRDFVFDMLSQRLASLLDVLDQVAFRRMDARLASWLLARARTQNPVQVTHQQVAVELGTSREVVSRLLKELARRGLVRTRRGAIAVVDAAGLEQRAAV